MKDQPVIIVVHETLARSIAADAVTLFVCLLTAAPGVLLSSAALQWTGAIMFLLWVLGRASGRSKRMSITQARAELDRIELACQ
jgi:hypothetical protein